MTHRAAAVCAAVSACAWGAAWAGVARNDTWTDVNACVWLAGRWAPNAMSSVLEDPRITVAFKAGKSCINGCSPGCNIDVLKNDTPIRDLGGITLYYQENADAMLQEYKKLYFSPARQAATQRVNATLRNLFPWMAEGYYNHVEGDKYQELAAYTHNGIFVIFRFNYRAVKERASFFEETPPRSDRLDADFVRFVNILARQVNQLP